MTIEDDIRTAILDVWLNGLEPTPDLIDMAGKAARVATARETALRAERDRARHAADEYRSAYRLHQKRSDEYAAKYTALTGRHPASLTVDGEAG